MKNGELVKGKWDCLIANSRKTQKFFPNRMQPVNCFCVFRLIKSIRRRNRPKTVGTALFVSVPFGATHFLLSRKMRGEKIMKERFGKMALIKCPECGQMVSDKAKTCIHCGSPLGEPDYTVRIKTPKDERAIVKVPYEFANDSTGEILGSVFQNQVFTLKVDKPIKIRVTKPKDRGTKPGFLDYVPHENARYVIYYRPGLFHPTLEFEEVDNFDSD